MNELIMTQADAPTRRTAAARPLRVLIVCFHYGPPWNEGVKNIVRVLHQQLQERGVECTVLAEYGERKDPAPKSFLSLLRQKAAFWRRAARTAREGGYDVIHLMSSITSVAGVKSFVLRRLSGVPVVAHFTGRGERVAGYRALLSADRVFVGGEYLKPYFAGSVSLPPLTPYMGEEGAEPIAPPARRLLFLGAMEEVRGVHHLIEALRILRDDLGHSDFTLTIAWNGYGEAGYDQRIRDMIAERGLERWVSWEVGESDVPALYRGHDLVIVPRAGGTRMAFPLRLVEAMSHARPVVTSDVGEMPRIVEGAGLVYPSGDERALAGAIHALLVDPELYLRSAAGALRRAAEYAPRRIVDTIVAAYQEIADAH
jgi:glycosyltransferase involved in cell wall biosynthesis